MELQLENTPNKTRKSNTIDMYIYTYNKNTSIHQYTTQRIQSIQRCLIQYAYTKGFNTQYVPKRNVQTTNLNNTSSCLAHEKASRYYST